jgi:CPA1 family monovalent cation:H+ antiporter
VVFLLIGLNVKLPQLWSNLGAIGVALGAVLVSRVLVVYGLSWLANLRQRGPRFPFSWLHVLFWGGLRGAISLALALSLPVTLEHRAELQAMTFGVVLFTLLAQGTTIGYLLERLGLIERSPHQVARELRLGQLFAAQAGLQRLEQLHREGLLTDEMWAGLRDGYRHEQRALTEEMNRLFREHAELEGETLLQARREALRAESGALRDALRRGLLSDKVYEELSVDIDRHLAALDLIQSADHDALTGGEAA